MLLAHAAQHTKMGQSTVHHDVRHATTPRPFAADMQRTLRRIPNLLRFSTRTSRMIRTIAALAALSTMTATANAADAGTTAAKQRYVSPGIANVTASAAPRPESTSSNARCRELAAGIDAVTHSPDRGQKVVRGMSPDGKPRNELRAYDKRADLEAEHQRLGCQ
ncbi:hypothetical protein A8E97_01970 [Burkholderia cenocepacia]|nr:hypothetical protein A8E88_24675 [Burkholderia cenocepacia]ONV89785.1 hypothetical protein A8E89_16910 [Burkholderia cenocepacia]ONW17194.1 hypothetical protein A8E90_16795 [Burkholderia cenocepacia]ONW17329.1 hypothetical protein A8E94_09690 [Burkholderia cenocepacia]ONW42729.1 hypothetical protein A8E99_16815 [Burkholderia cenocepacia]